MLRQSAALPNLGGSEPTPVAPPERLRTRLWHRLIHLRLRARGAWIALIVRVHGGRCGRRLCAGPRVLLKYPLNRNIFIGADVHLGAGCILEVAPLGILEIGDRVRLTAGSFVSANSRVSIGPDTLVGEYTSIRDADHDTRSDIAIIEQPMLASPIRIGSGVWIARGVAVLRGATIGDGAVIGANAVVRGSIPPSSTAVGVPARVVRVRS